MVHLNVIPYNQHNNPESFQKYSDFPEAVRSKRDFLILKEQF